MSLKDWQYSYWYSQKLLTAIKTIPEGIAARRLETHVVYEFMFKINRLLKNVFNDVIKIR